MAVEQQSVGVLVSKRTRGSMRADLRALRRFRSLIRYLVSTTLQTEKTGSVFGFVWWFLDPVLLMLVYWFLFGVIFSRAEPEFPIFILVSLISWEFFVTAVTTSMSITIAQERAMRQVAFPRSVIPLSVTIAQFTHLIAGLLFSVAAVYVVYGVVPSTELAAVVPLAVLQGIFTLGAAFIFAALNFFYRDVAHLAAYLFRLWYFMSPGVYAISRIPDRYRGWYQLNPYATFFGGYHAAILHERFPGAAAFAYTAVVSIVVLVGSYRLFVHWAPRFAKVV